MKKKRITSLVLVLVLLVSMLSVASISSASAAQTDPVNLLYAETYWTERPAGAPADSFNYKLTGYVEVENIAYAKNVTIVYSKDGKEWKETSAVYFKSTWGNKEAWTFTTDAITLQYRQAAYIQFAIKYEVNGATYWDNNNGYNHWTYTGGVSEPSVPAIGIAGLYVKSCYRSAPDSENILGTVHLKNIAPDKVVKMRYSTDNWATFTEVSASYVLNLSPEIEKWEFSATIPEGTSAEFAVSYTVNGVTYWDNNFGDNYTIA